jgi:hypothetical protein
MTSNFPLEIIFDNNSNLPAYQSFGYGLEVTGWHLDHSVYLDAHNVL